MRFELRSKFNSWPIPLRSIYLSIEDTIEDFVTVGIINSGKRAVIIISHYLKDKKVTNKQNVQKSEYQFGHHHQGQTHRYNRVGQPPQVAICVNPPSSTAQVSAMADPAI